MLTPELARELAAHKPELVALLDKAKIGIQPAPSQAVIPLSPGQARLWALMEVQQGSDVYHVPMVYRLRGALDIQALEKSLDQIQRRHAILRTFFLTVDGQPRQQVADPTTFSLEIAEGSHLAAAQQAVWVEEELAAGIRQPFDLGNGPLWRCVLLRLAGDEHILVITVHHIAFDRFSKGVFLRELEALYAGESVPDLAVQYRDFAYWQQSEAQRTRAEGHLAYWRARLSGAVSELLLPSDHPRPASITFEGRSERFLLPAILTDKLHILSRAAGGSMYMALLAGFHALLHRFTGQTDQIVCSPLACRTSTSAEALVGYFNNIVPMCTDLSGDPTFRDLLGRVRQIALDAVKHQDAPFQEITQIASVARTPLTRAMFNFRSDDSSHLRLPGLTSTPLENRRHQADFDLALYVGIENNTLAGVLDYNDEIFEVETIRSLLKNYRQLLESVVLDPDRPLSALPSLRSRFPEIESALASHPKIDDVAVIVRSDAGARSNLVAYVVLNEDDIPTEEELRDFLADRLPEDRGRLVFIPLDEFPTLADGDLDLAALPAATLSRQTPGNDYVAPRTALEEQLARIWARVLWRDEKIGIHDNFFDLGGHSLLSVQLISETEKHLNRSVSWARLGQLSTIAELARFLERSSEEAPIAPRPGLDAENRSRMHSYTAAWIGRRASPDSLITGLNTGGSKRPVFWCVQRYLQLTQMAKHLGPDQPIYGMRSAHRVMDNTPENISALAGYYADDILEIQGSGPLMVGGICQAAEIAFQVALRLITLGHEPSLLGLQERFIPHAYPGRVAFFFGDDSDRSPYYHYSQPELGWRKYYTGGFEVHIIRGAHGTYFQESNIPYLAQEMRLAFEGNRASNWRPPEHEEALPRLGRSAYRAELAVAKPAAPARGSTRFVVTVKNSSADTWQVSKRSGVFLGARWVNPRKSGIDRHSRYLHAAETRAPLPKDLKPADTVELELAVTLPEDPRLEILEVDMVDEGINWFSDAGSEAVQIRIPRR